MKNNYSLNLTSYQDSVSSGKSEIKEEILVHLVELGLEIPDWLERVAFLNATDIIIESLDNDLVTNDHFLVLKNQEGEEDALHSVNRGHCYRHDGPGDQVITKCLEEISAPTSAIAYVVANQVGDDCRVARIIFGDVCFDLSHQVRANISGFCKNSTTNLGKQSRQSTAKGKTNQRVGIFENAEKDGKNNEAQTCDAETHNRAAKQCNTERTALTLVGDISGLHVGPHANAHANIGCQQ